MGSNLLNTATTNRYNSLPMKRGDWKKTWERSIKFDVVTFIILHKMGSRGHPAWASSSLEGKKRQSFVPSTRDDTVELVATRCGAATPVQIVIRPIQREQGTVAWCFAWTGNFQKLEKQGKGNPPSFLVRFCLSECCPLPPQTVSAAFCWIT